MNETKHRLALDDRRELQVSGVRNVDSFDDQVIELDTLQGGLRISGSGLKIGGLDLASGRVTVTGQIAALEYGKSREEKSARHKSKSIMTRLLK